MRASARRGLDLLDGVAQHVAFGGRFGAAAGGTLIIEATRFGHFYSKAEMAAGATPDWASVFAY